MKTAMIATSLIALGFAGPAVADGKLDVVATAATASIVASGRGRRPVRLPTLDYSFQLLHDCDAPMTPRSLSLTIADSHRFLDASALQSANGIARMEVSIPASQLAPVILSDFCAAPGPDRPAGPEASRTLASLLSVAASLRCASDEKQRTIYSVTPLDVVLVCERPDATGTLETD